MKLLTYSYKGKQAVGVMSQDLKSVYPIKSLGFDFDSMQDFIEGTDAAARNSLSEKAKLGTPDAIAYCDVKKMAPIPRMRRDTICIGFNFKTHAQEIAKLRGEAAATAEVSYPIYFVKRTYGATGDGDAIPYRAGYAENLDCGVEVCVVMGRDALNITEDEVDDYILGYAVADDIGDTRINKVYTQPFLGKSLDGFMPVGPWIATVDEFGKNPVFELTLTQNGVVRQHGTTDSLTFSIPYIVSELSKNMTLKAGTMIETGSPANLNAGDPEKLKILPGDLLSCTISGIGTLSNPIAEEN